MNDELTEGKIHSRNNIHNGIRERGNEYRMSDYEEQRDKGAKGIRTQGTRHKAQGTRAQDTRAQDTRAQDTRAQGTRAQGTRQKTADGG